MINDTTIQKILDKYGLGKLVSWRKFSRSLIGAAFEINHNIVLKLNLDTVEDFRAERNANVAQLLAASGLPVSKLLALDTSKEIIPEKYVLFTKLEGDDLEEIWETLPPSEQRQIFLSLGGILARFHRIPLKGYGFILGEKQFTTLADFIADKYDNLYRYMDTNDLVSKEMLAQLNMFFQHHKKVLDVPVRPVFVHNDFQPKNITYSGGKITGIFDFDESIAGHNEYDFIKFYLPFKPERKQFATVVEGYRANGGVVSPEFPLRIIMYCLLFCMDLLRYIHSNRIADAEREGKFRKAMATLLGEGDAFS